MAPLEVRGAEEAEVAPRRRSRMVVLIMKRFEIQACPFCGSDRSRLLTRTAFYARPQNKGCRAVVCDCGAAVYGRTDEEAIAKWNRRDNPTVVSRIWVINELAKIASRANQVQVPDKSYDLLKAATDIARIYNNGVAELGTKLASFADKRRED